MEEVIKNTTWEVLWFLTWECGPLVSPALLFEEGVIDKPENINKLFLIPSPLMGKLK